MYKKLHIEKVDVKKIKMSTFVRVRRVERENGKQTNFLPRVLSKVQNSVGVYYLPIKKLKIVSYL